MRARLLGAVFGLGAVLVIGSATGEAAHCLDFRNDATPRIASYNNVGEFVRYEQRAASLASPANSPSAVETRAAPALDLSLARHASPLIYSIAEMSEEHVLTGVRVVLKVELSREPSESELRSIGEEMIQQESTRRRLNGIALFYYPADAASANVCALGRAVWAPNGNWDATHTVRLGDYASHQHVVATGGVSHLGMGGSASVAPTGDAVTRIFPERKEDDER